MATTFSSSFSTDHQEALELDVSVIEALLSRNRTSHSRTKYYQRLCMAFRSLLSSPILDLYPTLQSLREELQQEEQRKRKKRKVERVFWEITKDDNNDDEKQQQSVRDRLMALGRTIGKDLPNVLSRLEYAATAFFQEMARGFFLPLCTVAVGAMARIRTLLMQLGRYAIVQLDPLQNSYRTVYDDKDSSLWDHDVLEKAKEWFVEERDASKKTRQELTRQSLQSLGIAVDDCSSASLMQAKPGETDEKDYTPMPAPAGDNDDVGESVEEMEALPSKPLDTKPPLESRLEGCDGLDNNMSFVNELKTQKTKAKKDASKKEKKKKRSEEKSERKKKKKAKKGDFFDELFS